MRRSALEAERTRERIVAAAVHQTSTHGLSALTLGALASELTMSKAGVVGPFGSRDRLQLAVLERAAALFTEAVVAPSHDRAPGAPRLRALIADWCQYLADGPFPGGCFVTAAACELDGRPGELRDAVRDLVTRWRDYLREEVVVAQRAGDLNSRREPDELVTALNGIAMAANQEIQLLGDRTAAKRAHRLMLEVLDD